MENPYIVVEQKQEKKRRGALAILLAIAFCAILAIGSTFAYLTWTANQTPNRVTTGQLTADLLEPEFSTTAVTDNWKDGVANENTVKYTAPDGTAIPKNAYSMIPGDQFSKNPFVVNTSKSNAKGYAGIKLEFQKYNGSDWEALDADLVMACYTIDTTGANAENTKVGFGDFGANWYQIGEDGSLTDLSGSSAASDGTQKATAASEMYFINNVALSPMGVDDAANMDFNNNSTWGYSGDYASSQLFAKVTCAKSATTDDLNALATELAWTDDDGNAGTPAWRIVCSGAILQDTGTAPASMAEAAQKEFGLDMIDKLDAISSVNNGTGAKPTSSTGVRENLNANSSYYITSNTLTNANALPEPAPNNL